jgi:hypothetical protein
MWSDINENYRLCRCLEGDIQGKTWSEYINNATSLVIAIGLVCWQICSPAFLRAMT